MLGCWPRALRVRLPVQVANSDYPPDQESARLLIGHGPCSGNKAETQRLLTECRTLPPRNQDPRWTK